MARSLPPRASRYGGTTSEVVRLRLSTRGAGPGAPRSLVVKLAIPAPDQRLTAEHFDREVRFYRELAPSVDVRVPRLYHAETSAETGRSLLLLEDVGAAGPGDIHRGCDARQAAAVLHELASLHGAFWRLGERADPAWVPRLLGDLPARQARMQRAAPAFLASHGHRVPADVRALVEQLARHHDLFLEQLASQPRVLGHGDANLGNVLFPHDGGRAVLIDWQLIHAMPYAVDVARFLVGALPIDQRRDRERPLLEAYRARLSACGASAPALTDLLDAYRHGLLYRLAFLVVRWADIDPSTATPLQRANMDFEFDRAWLFTALRDHSAGEVLPPA